MQIQDKQQEAAVDSAELGSQTNRGLSSHNGNFSTLCIHRILIIPVGLPDPRSAPVYWIQHMHSLDSGILSRSIILATLLQLYHIKSSSPVSLAFCFGYRKGSYTCQEALCVHSRIAFSPFPYIVYMKKKLITFFDIRHTGDFTKPGASRISCT